MRQSNPKRGFTLLEVAIVIAIVGLLAGGIVGGKRLIQASKLHAVLDDATNYAISMGQFKAKYGEYPGDFSQATKVWGAADGGSGSDPTCLDDLGTLASTLTCNGNGNDRIDTIAEGYLTWQHFALAGMIRGTYTGAAGTAAVPGVNIPKGSLTNSGYWFGAWGYQLADAIKFYEGDYTNAFLLGAATADSWPSAPALNGMEAYRLDQKIDDGSPALGNVRSFNRYFSPDCVTDTDNGGVPVSTSAVYMPTTKAPTCVLIFMNTFKSASKF